MKLLFVTLCTLALTSSLWALPTYVGRSGAPGRSTCASSCHGSGGGTVQISGFPADYTPGQAYTLTIQRLSGNPIVNFNASCRVGSGTVNAGVIAAGTGTVTYNVPGETNGVHFSVDNQTSGTFNWTAPAAGTGNVRLYAGALQTDIDGENTTIVLTANEALVAPPAPINLVILPIGSTIRLDWRRVVGANEYRIYRDSALPVGMHVENEIGFTVDTTFTDINALPAPDLKFYYVVTAAN